MTAKRRASAAKQRTGTAAKRAATASRTGAPTHVALLRALNVGGTSVITMADLRTIFEKAGARDVRTILASGNVLFGADDVDGCIARVQAAFLKRGARKPPAIMVRSLAAIRTLVAARPYGAPMPPAGTTWYVSFLDAPPARTPTLPHTIPSGDVRYVCLVGLALCATVTPLPGGTSVDHFKPETLFKVSATVRNWNTVLRLIAE